MTISRAPSADGIDLPVVRWVDGRRLAVVDRPTGRGTSAGWARHLHDAGIDIVVSALEAREAAVLGLGDEGASARAVGPASGQGIGIHCAYGIGRSPMLAAAILGLTGMGPADAWLAVGDALGRAVPENDVQYAWVGRAVEAILMGTWADADTPLQPGG